MASYFRLDLSTQVLGFKSKSGGTLDWGFRRTIESGRQRNRSLFNSTIHEGEAKTALQRHKAPNNHPNATKPVGCARSLVALLQRRINHAKVSQESKRERTCWPIQGRNAGRAAGHRRRRPTLSGPLHYALWPDRRRPQSLVGQ